VPAVPEGVGTDKPDEFCVELDLHQPTDDGRDEYGDTTAPLCLRLKKSEIPLR
jgi:hypothetical protein